MFVLPAGDFRASVRCILRIFLYEVLVNSIKKVYSIMKIYIAGESGERSSGTMDQAFIALGRLTGITTLA